MSFLIGTLSFLMLAVSLFMILLVLIQRGRGGGLAGAFGGMGGSSAFGTRAGDTFTRITIVLAVIWVLLAGGLGMIMRRDAEASKTGKNSAFEEGAEAGKDETINDSGEMTSGDADDSKAAEPVKGDVTEPSVETKPDAAKATAPDAEKADAEKVEAPKTDAPKAEAEKVEPQADEKAASDEKPATPAEPAADAPATDAKP